MALDNKDSIISRGEKNMLEIETNIIGDIVLRESDESTGIGEI